MGLGKIILLLVLSDIGLAFGSDLLVENAGIIATNLGVDERIIAISLIAFGTSLPELTTSVIAAFKKEMDISIGNIIGSNLFNILGILGITAAVKNTDVNEQVVKFDIWYLGGISLLLFVMMLPARKAVIGRYKGTLLVLCYVLYIILVYSGKIA